MQAPFEDRPWIQRLLASSGVRSGYASAVVHVLVLIMLALLAVRQPDAPRRPRLVLGFTAAAEPDQGIAVAAGPAAAGLPDADVAESPAAPQPLAIAVVVEPPIVPIAPQPPQAVTEPSPEPTAVAARPASLSRDAPVRGAATGGDAFAARRDGGRGAAVRARGGSAASEVAVDRGLAWLAAHQAVDGSWRFDLSGCRCDGGCRDRGSVSSTTAATGIALLPFLGAGHTHVAGDHRETVGRGIYYLLSRMQPTPRGGDLTEGTMYGHGVATLALAEALGMTRDDMLARPLGDAVRFIETAQDTYGGGWRYLPGQAGDTTVTAWQIAALKSAALAGIGVPSPTIDAACRFLDRVQDRGGEAYGYQGPQPRPCTSAVGLLCRIYTGWHDGATIDRGLAALARPGPAPADVYRNFYLAQGLLLRDHAAWPRWNARNRDQLIASQARTGHETGSWFFADRETAPGGRLAHTALAVLTLEVYYRILPIYGPAAVDSGF